MYVATVALSYMTLLDPNNPTAPIVAGNGVFGGGQPQRIMTEDQDGEFREYAGGRIRLVLTPTQKTAMPVTLKALSRVQRDQIRAWAGTLLLIRDVFGKRIFGSYLQVQTQDVARSSVGEHADVQFTFTRVTYSDVV